MSERNIPEFPCGAALEIALVNNMPDQAVEATRAQFSRLLHFGSQGMAFQLRCYMVPSVPRSETARRSMAKSHDDIEALYARGADALIVTGTEPRADALEQEPYWNDFTRLVDWARHHTHGALWSCLAAHVAVQRLDGVKRRRTGEKLSGIFACETARDDWARRDAAGEIFVPHSRYNGLSQQEIEGCGYNVSSWSQSVGVDSFWRREPSLFLFTQGHPEYDADTLAREFRRDVLRYLSGERETFPTPPVNYFSKATHAKLIEIKAQHTTKERRRAAESLNKILSQDAPEAVWRNDAGRLYRNWLTLVASEKGRRLQSA
jgi:homoserine O-succinyltransferase